MTHRQQTINPKAFSLIEVLFSVAMFAIGIMGVVGLINQSMAASMNHRNEAIAGQLAQEGIELVRNIRDNNWLRTPAIDAFAGIHDGRIDYTNTGSVENSTDYNLQLNSSGLYAHNNSENIFKRRIVVTGDSINKTIQSVVTWGEVTPPSSPDENNCNPTAKCFYTEVMLNGVWGK
ncbi:MAG: prepilin-type N-terminal cleavage/methylation domain-containing protein [Parcubacteria group bacterium]|jgi:prepilin-type N-terminal cleavage/methylation domain-containing protein